MNSAINKKSDPERVRNSFLFSALLLFLLHFSGCVEEVEVSIPKENEKIVINSLFSPDTCFFVQVTKSAYIFDTALNMVNNAGINLYQNNELLDALKFQGNGLYYSKHKPIEGQKYRLEASVEGFAKLYAQNFVPAKTKILSTTRIDSVGKDEYDNAYSQAKITFQDNPDSFDYYEIILLFEYPQNPFFHVFDNDTMYYFGTDSIFKGFADLQSDDPAVAVEIEHSGFMGGPKSLFFTDRLFNGKKYTLTVNYSIINSPYINVDYTLYVYLNSISKEYYNYKKKLYLYEQNESDFWNNTGEIVQIYSNINNGYGIFAGYSSDVDTIYKK